MLNVYCSSTFEDLKLGTGNTQGGNYKKPLIRRKGILEVHLNTRYKHCDILLYSSCKVLVFYGKFLQFDWQDEMIQ